MDIRELRIGNLLLLNDCIDKSVYYVVHEIIHDGKGYQIGVDKSSLLLPDFCWDPIPITPEWLERLGFERKLVYPGDTYFRLRGFEVLMDSEGEFYYLGDKWSSPQIGFIHKLQNLYFALTDEELTIK